MRVPNSVDNWLHTRLLQFFDYCSFFETQIFIPGHSPLLNFQRIRCDFMTRKHNFKHVFIQLRENNRCWMQFRCFWLKLLWLSMCMHNFGLPVPRWSSNRGPRLLQFLDYCSFFGFLSFIPKSCNNRGHTVISNACKI